MKNTRKNFSVVILIIINQFFVSGQIDNDGISDLTHGDMISRFLEEGLSDAEIVKFDLQNPDNPVFAWRAHNLTGPYGKVK